MSLIIDLTNVGILSLTLTQIDNHLLKGKKHKEASTAKEG